MVYVLKDSYDWHIKTMVYILKDSYWHIKTMVYTLKDSYDLHIL